MPQHLLLVPSLSCPAECLYCFGPKGSGPVMRPETIDEIVAWQNRSGETEPLEVIFHGGEPLAAGAAFYREALPRLRKGLAQRTVGFSVQSNLWLLDEALIDLFREYRVSIGTSLDGPEAINDAQRGPGYFRRTMAGIDRARRGGLSAGCICTFTAASAPEADRIFDFFLGEQLNFTVHAAVPPLRPGASDPWSISPRAYGELLVSLMDRYLENLHRIRISTLDILSRSVSSGKGGLCTFNDCLGGYLSVGADGEVHPCQRFGGRPEYGLGHIRSLRAPADVADSPVGRLFVARQRRVDAECGDCPYLAICRGGCAYNQWAAAGGRPDPAPRDPYCPAYRRIFDHIVQRGVEEFFSRDHLDALVDGEKAPRPGSGRLLSIMGRDAHPFETARHARRVAAAVALAETDSASEAARKLQALGLTSRVERAVERMEEYRKTLTTPGDVLGNLYLHVTFACPLSCSHCYARSGPDRTESQSVDKALEICREAARLGFRHLVITGGEPLAHPERDALLEGLGARRGGIKPSLSVLRTSLALPMDEALVRRLGRSADQVVVSVDGDRSTHDERRGPGSYDLVVDNLRRLLEAGGGADVSIAAVLPLRLVYGPPGESVRALAAELGIRRVRFRPVLPIGRAAAAEAEAAPESLWGHVRPEDMLAYGFHPVTSCGIGQNLYIEPDGGAYPCYAWHGPRWKIGQADGPRGLSELIRSPAFLDLRRHNVDSIRRCRTCPLRYLCGGACRAWNQYPLSRQTDLDAPPRDCSSLHRRALSLLKCALDQLRVSVREWEGVGLSFPARPPEIDEGADSKGNERRESCPFSDLPISGS